MLQKSLREVLRKRLVEEIPRKVQIAFLILEKHADNLHVIG